MAQQRARQRDDSGEPLRSSPLRPLEENADLAEWQAAGKPARTQAESDRLYAEHCKRCDLNLKGCGHQRACKLDHLPLPSKCFMATATCEKWDDGCSSS